MTGKIVSAIIAIVLVCAALSALGEGPDYSDPALWAYYGSEGDMPADVFFICPSSAKGAGGEISADLTNEEDIAAMRKSIGMQSLLYNASARYYAPYYRQLTIASFGMPAETTAQALETAYSDVKAAFEWYMANANEGRPIVIAGFSLGAQLGIMLLKDYAEDPDFQSRFVAAYLPGWRLTEADIEECPFLKPAAGETDTGVIICFECEAEYITDTIVIPEGTFTYSINPLTWSTSSAPAGKELNLGYVYPAGDGSVKQEIPQLCGCYIDEVRGALKVTDISAADFPSRMAVLPEGSYHIYDYEFFYRNIQKNVTDRIEAFINN